NHAWFFVDNKNHLSFGELCLNTKCLKKMNTPKPTSNSVEATDDKSTAPSVAVFDNPQKTVECRDRFILSNMPMRVEGSEVLQKRLILLSVICCIETDHREEVFKIAYPGTKDIYMPFAIEFLEEIKKIPAKKLDEVIERAIIESAVHIEGDVLTALIEEAGIKLSNEVVVDEEYLKAMTKNQLTDFIKEMKITPIFGEGMSPAKKGDTITAILADDLQGKMPPTLAKSFECE
ncbi:MAG: hypothetical protein KAT46_05295, partial [Deltaproteobacteria bacterium]|nr:hypothetical protein [Deltaproteobacteria bacterium]